MSTGAGRFYGGRSRQRRPSFKCIRLGKSNGQADLPPGKPRTMKDMSPVEIAEIKKRYGLK